MLQEIIKLGGIVLATVKNYQRIHRACRQFESHLSVDVFACFCRDRTFEALDGYHRPLGASGRACSALGRPNSAECSKTLPFSADATSIYSLSSPPSCATAVEARTVSACLLPLLYPPDTSGNYFDTFVMAAAASAPRVHACLTGS